LDVECLIQQVLLLKLVNLANTSCSRGLRTTGHANHFRHVRNEVTQVLVVERPWTLVSWLILNERDLRYIREGHDCVTQRDERTWVAIGKDSNASRRRLNGIGCSISIRTMAISSRPSAARFFSKS